MSIKKDADMSVSTSENKEAHLSAAIGYSELLNWHIFPIHYKTKKPITQHGFKDATWDVEQIKSWWNKYPNANIGLPTGWINNIVVIDVDPRNGGNISFERLLDEYELIPHTVECLTGGGGNHYYLKYDERINKSTIKDYPGIDIQSDGKYVILPPSIHPSGKAYEWELSSRPLETLIAEPPSWLIDRLQRKTQTRFKAKPASDFLNILQGVADGERNNSMMSLIGHLLAKKVDYRVSYELVRLWNERNDPPLSDEVVTKAFNNILRREAEKR